MTQIGHEELQSIERLAYWMRSDDSRASVMAADKLLDRGWGRPSHDVKLQAELGPGLAEIVREARERAIGIDAMPIIVEWPKDVPTALWQADRADRSTARSKGEEA